MVSEMQIRLNAVAIVMWIFVIGGPVVFGGVYALDAGPVEEGSVMVEMDAGECLWTADGCHESSSSGLVSVDVSDDMHVEVIAIRNGGRADGGERLLVR